MRGNQESFGYTDERRWLRGGVWLSISVLPLDVLLHVGTLLLQLGHLQLFGCW